MQNLSLVLGSGGIVGIIVLLFYCGRCFGKMESNLKEIVSKLDSMERKTKEEFLEVKESFENVNCRLKGIDDKVALIASRIDRLEVRVEERTLRVVHMQKPQPPHELVEA